MASDMVPDSSPPERRPISTEFRDNFKSRPFTLSVAALRRINGIMLSRLPGELLFDVLHSDGTESLKVDLERVLGDDNSKSRSITRIRCSLNSDSKEPFTLVRIVLTFTADGHEPISLQASAEDQERLWPTLKELRECVSSEVARRSGFPWWVMVPFYICVPIGVYLWSATLLNTPSQAPTLVGAIRSADPNVKLNYLIFAAGHYFIDPRLRALFVSVLSVLVLLLVDQYFGEGVILTSLFPRNYFAIGKGAHRWENVQQLRSKVLWLVIGVLAGLLVQLAVLP